MTEKRLFTLVSSVLHSFALAKLMKAAHEVHNNRLLHQKTCRPLLAGQPARSMRSCFEGQEIELRARDHARHPKRLQQLTCFVSQSQSLTRVTDPAELAVCVMCIGRLCST